MNKLIKLKNILKEMDSALIAFSGGADSAFLLKIAKEQLGKNAVAVTASSPFHPEWETNNAIKFAKNLGVRHILIEGNELKVAEIRKNPLNRCYYCKKKRFIRLLKLAKKMKIKHVCDGTNTDDFNDYRPGMKACEELHIRHPLVEAGFSKREIRSCSKKLGLLTWNKPTNSCLATRIPFKQKIESELLQMIEEAEIILGSLIKGQYRVRIHGKSARIETEKRYFTKVVKNKDSICRRFRELGFVSVSLDLDGYRTGSMNPRKL